MILSARKPKLNSTGICRWPFQGSFYIFPCINVCFLFLWVFCFCNHFNSCCVYVLVMCCSDGCLLCVLCFLHELFPLIYVGCATFGGNFHTNSWCYLSPQRVYNHKYTALWPIIFELTLQNDIRCCTVLYRQIYHGL